MFLAARSPSWLLIVCNLEPKNQDADALILHCARNKEERGGEAELLLIFAEVMLQLLQRYYFFKLCLQCNSPHHFSG